MRAVCDLAESDFGGVGFSFVSRALARSRSCPFLKRRLRRTARSVQVFPGINRVGEGRPVRRDRSGTSRISSHEGNASIVAHPGNSGDTRDLKNGQWLAWWPLAREHRSSRRIDILQASFDGRDRGDSADEFRGAGEPVRHHGSIRETSEVNTPAIDTPVLSHSGDELVEKIDLIYLVRYGGIATGPRIPESVDSGGRYEHEPFEVGLFEHLGQFILLVR